MLAESFPEDREIKGYRNKLRFALDSNPSLVLEVVMDSLEPYAEYILKGEDSLLSGADADELKRKLQKGGCRVNGNLLCKIQGLWSEMSVRFQSIVKQNLLLILVLGTQASRNRGLMTKINSYRRPECQLSV